MLEEVGATVSIDAGLCNRSRLQYRGRSLAYSFDEIYEHLYEREQAKLEWGFYIWYNPLLYGKKVDYPVMVKGRIVAIIVIFWYTQFICR